MKKRLRRITDLIFSLLAKRHFIEITGPSGTGKSWLLSHLAKHLQGVKFTNMPTSRSVYTLSKQDLERHIAGKWDAPNKWYYFLDDINTFQKWSQKELGNNGYSALLDYISQAGKLGGTFIWTNNGPKDETVFETSKNISWTVWNYIEFLDNKSFLFVRTSDSWTSWLPTFIAIDNKEIQACYDPHWNIPRDYQENWLKYIFVDKLQAEEGAAILRVIKQASDKASDEQILKEFKANRNLLFNYLEERKREEGIARHRKNKVTKVKEGIIRYDLTDQKLTSENIERFDQIDKGKKASQTLRKVKSRHKKEPVEPLVDEDQEKDPDLIHQEPDFEDHEQES